VSSTSKTVLVRAASRHGPRSWSYCAWSISGTIRSVWTTVVSRPRSSRIVSPAMSAANASVATEVISDSVCSRSPEPCTNACTTDIARIKCCSMTHLTPEPVGALCAQGGAADSVNITLPTNRRHPCYAGPVPLNRRTPCLQCGDDVPVPPATMVPVAAAGVPLERKGHLGGSGPSGRYGAAAATASDRPTARGGTGAGPWPDAEPGGVGLHQVEEDETTAAQTGGDQPLPTGIPIG